MNKFVMSIISLLLVFSMLTPFQQVEASESKSYERIAGDNRIQTAIEISKEGWPKGVGHNQFGTKVVILARADVPADALAAASLVGKKDAPILLTYSDKLPEETLKEIERLKPEHIYILGGEKAISESIDKKLDDKGFIPIRIAGDDRFQTANWINIFSGGHLDSTDTAIIANGETIVDALSASSFSALNNIPIFLAKKR
ncbi:cell wall-binding repeat-containing protein [Bacillus carboniphilus]|uniref:Cell wall-binding repeat-containing protein n=1 Tax=Bacillus carboniphilus TaxID=86663 RepID=A0ABY9JQ47_9BACI|nr:cell wall-binding repeat-containing protein [Bacillus carboniphilus]WLR41524.1 cell wall-binding repeat-containing protein [Bacillus carboniphilus]